MLQKLEEQTVAVKTAALNEVFEGMTAFHLYFSVHCSKLVNVQVAQA
jgi:hypothetical protein